jgi:hypothetical protein
MKGTFKIKNNSERINFLTIKSKTGLVYSGVFFEPKQTRILHINGTVKGIDFDIIPTNKAPYVLKKLPKPEKTKAFTNKIDDLFSKVVFSTKIQNFGTIAARKKLFVNPDFAKKLKKDELLFVIGHEIGHRYYNTETYCDLFALYYCTHNNVDVRFISYDNILKCNKRKRNIQKYIKIKKW